jgi:hypothetical protein
LDKGIATRLQLTFDVNVCKVELEVIDGRKQDFDVKDEFLSTPDGIEIEPVANMPQHF